MTPIGQIILDVLEQHDSCCLDNDAERELVAERCEQKLGSASLLQLAELLGGSLDDDNDGQAIIYTGVQL